MQKGVLCFFSVAFCLAVSGVIGPLAAWTSLEDIKDMQKGTLQSSQVFGGSMNDISRQNNLQSSQFIGRSLNSLVEKAGISEIILLNSEGTNPPLDNDPDWRDFGSSLTKQDPLINCYYYSSEARQYGVVSSYLSQMPFTSDLKGRCLFPYEEISWCSPSHPTKKTKINLQANQVMLALYKPKHHTASDLKTISLPTHQEGTTLKLELICQENKFKNITVSLGAYREVFKFS